MQAGTLTVDLIANTASFNSNIEKAAANLNSNTAKINRSLEGMKTQFEHASQGAKLLVEALAVKEVAEAVKGTLEFAAAMKIQADRIGVTAETMQLYHLAGKRVGSTNDEIDTGLKKLTVSMGQAELGSKKQQEIFKALGVDYHATATVAIPQLADGLAKIGNDAKRHALEVATMGRAAVALDPLFKQGAEGIARMKEEAEKAGLILGDQFAEKAHEASVKMDELVTILKVDFSKEVINNTDAIIGMANGLTVLIREMLSFASQYPAFTAMLSGGIVGALKGGVPGAVIGAGGGLLLQAGASRMQADGSTNLSDRLAALNKAQMAVQYWKNRPADGMGQSLFSIHRTSPGLDHFGTQEGAAAELVKQQGLLSAARGLALSRGYSIPKPDGIGNLLGGGGSRRNAQTPADHTDQYQKAFEDQSARLDEQLLSAKRANVTDVSQIAGYEKQAIAVEAQKLNTDLTIAERKNPILAAHDAELREKIKQVANEKLLTVNTAEMLKKWNDDLEMQIAANDNQKELLSIQDQLAVTQAEHRKIQLAILDAEKQNLLLELQKQFLNSKDVKERERIQAQKDAIPGVYAAKAEVVKNQTAGPGEAYLKSIIDDAKSVNEALQNIEVSGLKSLNDGLVEAIMGAKSLGEVFTNVANQIIADLLRIAIQKMIIGPIAKAIFGGSGGGSAASSAITVDTTGNIFNHFAAGTNNAPSGMALVGENGPELVRFRGGQQVIPNNMLNSGGGKVQVEIVDTTQMFVMRVNNQIISAAPAIAEAGSTVAQSRLAYRQSRSLAA